MFRIGDFSRIARVSCRLLRYYDEISLLSPHYVDGDSGYRYYSAAQLPRLNRILVLRELGLSLGQIARVMEDNLSPSELRAMLLLRRSDVERAVEAESDRLRLIEVSIAQIDNNGELSTDDVIMRSEPAHLFLSLRRTVDSFAHARVLIRELHEAVHGRVHSSALGSLVAVAHATEFEADLFDVEIGFTLTETVPVAPTGLILRELEPMHTAAVCVRVGPPEHAHLVTGRIGAFVEASGYELAGSNREFFLQRPRLDHTEDWVVEMQFPIRKRRVIPAQGQAGTLTAPVQFE
ncbi:MAG: MerR family transcriptional regulator [Gammaproteobacteria bacterium]|nr:MerR family transcriptional regulator [Gammaproteobacteria bacterium]MDP2139822.1 MerR family transcriptional regulator [Gammaproteobacteria bacterium]MDP2347062.1 MerR family transcriptional regulator [Gammaproteobacteria bacterium]